MTKICVAEDDPLFRRVLQGTLTKWQYEVILTRNGEEAWQVLQQADGPCLALLDWMMPGLDGCQLCARVRTEITDRYIYIMLLTAKDQKTDLVHGLDAGADDYLSKPFEPAELHARLLVGQRILEMQRQLIAAREAMRYQALHDALTGIWNRRAITDILARELDRTNREANPFGLLLIDVDHFKQINDRFGHAIGDAVLRGVTKTLSTQLRPYDQLGRWGGEEFLAVMPNCTGTETQQIGDRLRAAVAAETLRCGLHEVTATISIGAVVYQGASQAHDAGPLLHAADCALYRAKNTGRNRLVMGVVGEGMRALQDTLPQREQANAARSIFVGTV